MSGLQIVIDSRGGGGHIAAREALASRWNASMEGRDTRRIDFLGKEIIGSVKLPFIGNLGEYAVNRWNEAQIHGDIHALNSTVSLRWLSDLVFYPIAVKKLTEILRNLSEEPERIVSTQALCIDAIAQAILTVNKEKGWNMRLQVHMTDLPTEKATHFYRSLATIGYNSHLSRIVTLYAPAAPPCDQEETPAHFWKRHVGNIRVVYPEKPPIREAFFHYPCTINKEATVEITINHPHEANIIALGSGISSAEGIEKIPFRIRPQDKVATLLLGSQPPSKAVNGYIDAFVETARKQPISSHHYLFVYCGKPEAEQEQNELLRSVETRLRTYANEGGLPENFYIIPFTRQEADTLAPLFHRSNVTITKAGGSTCFELMQLYKDEAHQMLPIDQQRTVFLHSEGLVPKGGDFSDFFVMIWLAILDFFKWYLGVKEHLDPTDIYPDYLTKNDHREMRHTCLVAARNHGLSSNLHVHPLFNEKLLLDPAPHLPASKGFEAIMQQLRQEDETRRFAENDRVALIEHRTAALMDETPNNSLSYEEMRKIAVGQLLVERGVALWEAGNAEMIQSLMKANVVSPTYVSQFLPGAFFEETSRSNSPVTQKVQTYSRDLGAKSPTSVVYQ